MSQIFVFTAGDPGAREHLGESIAQSIGLDLVTKTVEATARESIRAISDSEGGLWAWGSVPTERNRAFWEKMAVGDWVLCVFENTYHYAARVTLKLEHEALARSVWGETSEGTTWSLMYFLSRPISIARPVASLATFLNNGYRGFTRIGDERIARIEASYGTVDRFIETAVTGSGSAPVHHFLIRSNEDSEYGDEIGVRYHFTNTVPNSRSLANGGKVVVDRKAPGGAVLIGYGELGAASREEREGKTHFVSPFRSWTPTEPRSQTHRERAALEAVDGYNVQHAVRPITREVYEMLTRQPVRKLAAVEDLRKAADAFGDALREAGVTFGGQHNQLVRAFVASLITKPLANSHGPVRIGEDPDCNEAGRVARGASSHNRCPA